MTHINTADDKSFIVEVQKHNVHKRGMLQGLSEGGGKGFEHLRVGWAKTQGDGANHSSGIQEGGGTDSSCN